MWVINTATLKIDLYDKSIATSAFLKCREELTVQDIKSVTCVPTCLRAYFTQQQLLAGYRPLQPMSQRTISLNVATFSPEDKEALIAVANKIDKWGDVYSAVK